MSPAEKSVSHYTSGYNLERKRLKTSTIPTDSRPPPTNTCNLTLPMMAENSWGLGPTMVISRTLQITSPHEAYGLSYNSLAMSLFRMHSKCGYTSVFSIPLLGAEGRVLSNMEVGTEDICLEKGNFNKLFLVSDPATYPPSGELHSTETKGRDGRRW